MLAHPFEPVYDERSRVLILGTFPSVASRETAFYYGHPRNRFWRVLADVFSAPCPAGNAEKRAFLLANRVALWDVAGACEITGSQDASIKSAQANDIGRLLARCEVRAIFANGKTAKRLYDKLIFQQTHVDIIPLPSTSPANAACSLEKLKEAWRAVAEAAK